MVLNRREQAACRLIPRRGRGTGAQPHAREQKEARLLAFSEGNERIIVTKPKIAGMGLTAHCADGYCSTFSSGISTKIAAIYRFRQALPVTCHG